jgi:hypothetical protein
MNEEQQEKTPEQNDVQTLQRMLAADATSAGSNATLIKTFIAGFAVSVVICIIVGIVAIRAVAVMRETYQKNTESVILARSNMESANAWEQLSPSQKRERLQDQYFQIVRYYTTNVAPNQKLNDDQIMSTFNSLWETTSRVNSVNFFLPVAYMKVKTNFNPAFGNGYQSGIAGLYFKEADQAANLSRVKTDQAFQVVFKGSETLLNSDMSIKLLVAEFDDLLLTFNGRVDWALYAKFTNVYDVMAKYWKNGEGQIPDSAFKTGDFAEAYKYYNAFKTWTIPSKQDSKDK